MSQPHRLTFAEYAAIAAIVLIYGINNAGAKYATETLPPMLAGASRFVISALILFPLAKPPFPQPLRLFTIAVLAGPVHFSLIYLGFSLAHDLSPLAVSMQLWIPLTALFSWILLKEPMSRGMWAGVATAFLGVAVMTLDEHAVRDWRAIMVGALASTAWSLAMVVTRRTTKVKPLKLQALTALVAAPVLSLESALFERDRWGTLLDASPLVWGTILWGAIASTLVASVLLFWLVQRREAGRVTSYMLATPLVTCAIGVSLMGDVITPQIAIGALACTVGVALVAIAEGRRKAGAPVAPAEQAA
jgi:O-acetylserine/cysteine efflux transporter